MVNKESWAGPMGKLNARQKQDGGSWAPTSGKWRCGESKGEIHNRQKQTVFSVWLISASGFKLSSHRRESSLCSFEEQISRWFCIFPETLLVFFVFIFIFFNKIFKHFSIFVYVNIETREREKVYLLPSSMHHVSIPIFFPLSLSLDFFIFPIIWPDSRRRSLSPANCSPLGG